MKNQEAVKLINTILDSEKLSKSALAEKIGVSKQYISQIFKGEKNIGINTLAKIKEHFPKYLDDKIDVPDKLNKDSFVSLRKQIGYTQSKLAEALGISQAIVAKLGQAGLRLPVPADRYGGLRGGRRIRKGRYGAALPCIHDLSPRGTHQKCPPRHRHGARKPPLYPLRKEYRDHVHLCG